jgi:hypothetical protein
MSALSLEKDGRVLSSKRTKHIKVKYFLIKDYRETGKIDAKFYPTNDTWADVPTKPLQGQKIRDMMRAFLQLQNCAQNYDNDAEMRVTMNLQDVAKPHTSTNT